MAKKEQINCDIVEVVTDGKTLSGMVMPNSSEHTLVLKLDSGYNIGISRKKISKINIVKKFGGNEKKCESGLELHASGKVNQRKDLPVVSLLHFGGTIASMVDYSTGAVIPRFDPEEVISMFPELGKIVQLRARLLRNMFSEDMRFSHYNLLAEEILKELKNGAKGVIVTHGTDTLAYTAAALSFMLEGLDHPVLVVGSQRSSDRGSSDAALNLLCASTFIANGDFGGVAICMHADMSDERCVILPACKTRKFHSSRRDAFKPVNAEPIAYVGKDGAINFVQKKYKKASKGLPVVKKFRENLEVGMVYAHPQMGAEDFLHYKDYEGLVIIATGLGRLPINNIDNFTKGHEKIAAALRILAKKMPVIITTQTLFGRIHLPSYSTGVKLKEMGILGDLCDMLPETAFIKLAWLLSNYPKDKVRELIGENLRGEISACSNTEMIDV